MFSLFVFFYKFYIHTLMLFWLLHVSICFHVDFNPIRMWIHYNIIRTNNVSGIGPKTALKLIRQHGSIENIIAVFKKVRYFSSIAEYDYTYWDIEMEICYWIVMMTVKDYFRCNNGEINVHNNDNNSDQYVSSGHFMIHLVLITSFFLSHVSVIMDTSMDAPMYLLSYERKNVCMHLYTYTYLFVSVCILMFLWMNA